MPGIICDLGYMNSWRPLQARQAVAASDMQRCFVGGSVCTCVPWKGTGSIADINEMEATSEDRGGMEKGVQCSVCSFVPWTRTGSIADINKMEATSGHRAGMETGSFVLCFFVVSSAVVFSCVVWQVASLSSSSTRNVVRSHGSQRAAVLVEKSEGAKTKPCRRNIAQ